MDLGTLLEKKGGALPIVERMQEEKGLSPKAKAF